IFTSSAPSLWLYAEQCLYWQYYDHYARIAPWLERLEREAPENALGSWGRLIALCALRNHIDLQTLFAKLERKGSTTAWEGAAQVLTANLDRPESARTCHAGLMYLLGDTRVAGLVANVVAPIFLEESKHPYIDHKLATAYLRSLEGTNKDPNF